MVRPRKPRHCACPHRAEYTAVYKPAGTPLATMEKSPCFTMNWRRCTSVTAKG